jgi:hypothetical protein
VLRPTDYIGREKRASICCLHCVDPNFRLSGLDERTGAGEVIFADPIPPCGQLRPSNAGLIAVVLQVAYEFKSMLSQQVDMRRMRLAVDQVRPLSHDHFPNRFRVRPMPIPLARCSERGEIDLMRHRPSRLQPGVKGGIRAVQLEHALQDSMRQNDVDTLLIDDVIIQPRRSVFDRNLMTCALALFENSSNALDSGRRKRFFENGIGQNVARE